MTFGTDITTDSGLFDGGQTVTLTQRRAEGDTVVSVANALNLTLARRQIQALGGVSLNGDEMAWSLNATEPGTAGVVVGDTITDAVNVVWSVISVKRMTLDSRWIVMARKQQ